MCLSRLFRGADSNCRVLESVSLRLARWTRRAEEMATYRKELLSGHPSHCFVGLAEFTRFYEEGSEIGRMQNPKDRPQGTSAGCVSGHWPSWGEEGNRSRHHHQQESKSTIKKQNKTTQHHQEKKDPASICPSRHHPRSVSQREACGITGTAREKRWEREKERRIKRADYGTRGSGYGFGSAHPIPARRATTCCCWHQN